MADNSSKRTSKRKSFEPLRQHESNQKNPSQGQPDVSGGDFYAYLTSSQVPTSYPDTVWRSAAETSAIHTLAARDRQKEEQGNQPSSPLKAAGIEGSDFNMPAPDHSSERDADSLADAALLATPELLPTDDGPDNSGPDNDNPSPKKGKKQTRTARLKQKQKSGLIGELENRMGTALGKDINLSGLRFHTDSNAQAMAKSIQAKAFITGNDVYLGAGQALSANNHTLLHEVAHYVQNTNQLAAKAHSASCGCTACQAKKKQVQRQADQRPALDQAQIATFFYQPQAAPPAPPAPNKSLGNLFAYRGGETGTPSTPEKGKDGAKDGASAFHKAADLRKLFTYQDRTAQKSPSKNQDEKAIKKPVNKAGKATGENKNKNKNNKKLTPEAPSKTPVAPDTTETSVTPLESAGDKQAGAVDKRPQPAPKPAQTENVQGSAEPPAGGQSMETSLAPQPEASVSENSVSENVSENASPQLTNAAGEKSSTDAGALLKTKTPSTASASGVSWEMPIAEGISILHSVAQANNPKPEVSTDLSALAPEAMPAAPEQVPGVESASPIAAAMTAKGTDTTTATAPAETTAASTLAGTGPAQAEPAATESTTTESANAETTEPAAEIEQPTASVEPTAEPTLEQSGDTAKGASPEATLTASEKVSEAASSTQIESSAEQQNEPASHESTSTDISADTTSAETEPAAPAPTTVPTALSPSPTDNHQLSPGSKVGFPSPPRPHAPITQAQSARPLVQADSDDAARAAAEGEAAGLKGQANAKAAELRQRGNTDSGTLKGEGESKGRLVKRTSHLEGKIVWEGSTTRAQMVQSDSEGKATEVDAQSKAKGTQLKAKGDTAGKALKTQSDAKAASITQAAEQKQQSLQTDADTESQTIEQEATTASTETTTAVQHKMDTISTAAQQDTTTLVSETQQTESQLQAEETDITAQMTQRNAEVEAEATTRIEQLRAQAITARAEVEARQQAIQAENLAQMQGLEAEESQLCGSIQGKIDSFQAGAGLTVAEAKAQIAEMKVEAAQQWENLKAKAAPAMAAMQKKWNSVQTWAAPHMAALGEKAGQAAEWVMGKLGAAKDWAQQKWTALSTKAGAAYQGYQQKVMALRQGIATKASEAKAWAGEKIAAVQQMIGNKISAATANLQAKATAAASFVSEKVTAAVAWAGEKVTAAKEAVSSLATSATETLSSAVSAGKQFVTSKVGAAKDWLTGKASAATAKLGGMVSEFGGALTSKGEALASALSNTADSFANFLSSRGGAIGRFFGNLLGSLMGTVRNAGSAAVGMVRDAGSSASQFLSSVSNQATSFLADKATQAVDFLGNAGTRAMTAFTTRANQAMTFVKEKGAAALSFVGEKGSQAMGFLKEKGGSALSFIKEKGQGALSFVKEKGAAMVSFAQEKGAAALSYMGDKANQILDVIQDPLGAAKNALSAAWETAKGGWSKAQSVMGPLWEATKNKVAQAGQALNESVLQPALAFAQEKGQQAMAYMKERFPGLANCFEVAIDLAGQATAFVSEKMEQAGAWVTEHYDKLSMAGHLMLDGLGMVPGFGAIADGLNAVWYLAEGNYTDAALSTFAAIPGIGDAAAAAKLGSRASKLGKTFKAFDKAGDALSGVKSAASAIGKTVKTSGPAKQIMAAADTARAFVDKVPDGLKQVVARYGNEIEAGAEFSVGTVMELNAAYAQYGDDLTAEQIQQIVLGNALSTTVGYGIGKGINKAADKWLPSGGVDVPTGKANGVDVNTSNNGRKHRGSDSSDVNGSPKKTDAETQASSSTAKTDAPPAQTNQPDKNSNNNKAPEHSPGSQKEGQTPLGSQAPPPKQDGGVLGANAGRNHAREVKPGGNSQAISGHGGRFNDTPKTNVPEGTHLVVARDNHSILDETGGVLENIDVEAFAKAKPATRERLVNEQLDKLGITNPITRKEVFADLEGVRVVKPGESIDDYLVGAPKDLKIYENSTSVAENTRLSDVLQKDKGYCTLATCTEYIDALEPKLPSKQTSGKTIDGPQPASGESSVRRGVDSNGKIAESVDGHNAQGDRTQKTPTKDEGPKLSNDGGRAGIDNLGWDRQLGENLSDQDLSTRVEQIRQELLKQSDVGRVRNSLQEYGLNIDDKMIADIKRYNFDSKGIAFTTDNYNAWRRLATGKGSVDDVRYLVHEAAEVAELRKVQQQTGFDFTGKKYDDMSKLKQDQWDADFERNYLQAHSTALHAEYDFIAEEVSKVTNGRVNITKEIAASIDPTRNEAHKNMLFGDIPLKDHNNFERWKRQGDEIIDIGKAARERIGLYSNPRLSELIGALKRRRLSQ